MNTKNTETPHLSAQAARHLWMHFSRMGVLRRPRRPGHRARRRALRLGPVRQALPRRTGRPLHVADRPRAHRARRGGRQAGRDLAYFPLWTYAHPRPSSWPSGSPSYAPGDLNRVFFTTGGSEAVESAWKLARQYFRIQGKPQKTKVISRAIAYHGTTMGALSITGIPDLRTPFEPLVPGTVKVPEHQLLPGPGTTATTKRPSAGGRPTRSSGPSSARGPTRSPPSSSSRCRTPAAASRRRPGTSSGCARSATATASSSCPTRSSAPSAASATGSAALRYEYQPDIITVAKGLTTGYAPLGAMIASGPGHGALPRGGRVLPPRLHLRRPPGELRRGPGQPRRVRGRRDPRARAGHRGRVPQRARDALRPAHRRRRAGRRLLLRDRAGQGQGRPGSPSTTTSPSACCAASCPAPCSRQA